jgi:hypothetical protein
VLIKRFDKRNQFKKNIYFGFPYQITMRPKIWLPEKKENLKKIQNSKLSFILLGLKKNIKYKRISKHFIKRINLKKTFFLTIPYRICIQTKKP